ncbi:hypothetical protein [Oceanicaulis sp.]|uniref:hypothetical protein n=1 Tax=Oceanicaulis sp. TaxID=1924941 RepID=UPI003F71C72B
MELATADAVQPREGEAAFILQLRPPETANADALASGLDRFTSLFLERAVSDQVRFSPLGALTWALCAPTEHVDDVDAACDELASTLFGDPASEAVHLARQPDQPRQEDYRIQNQALSDEEGEAVMQDLAEHEWDLDAKPESADPAADPDEDSFDLDDPTIDLDAFDASEDDDWDLVKPIDEDPVVILDEGSEDTELEAEAEAEPEAEPEAETEVSDASLTGEEADFEEQDQTDADDEASADAEEEFELADAGDDSADDVDVDEGAFALDAPEDANGSLDHSEDDDFVLARDDLDDAADLDAMAPDAGLANVLEDALDEINATSRIWDENADTVDIDDIAASALHETRLGSQVDIAAELSAFREEMKTIAQSIPSGGMDAALSDFRAGLETLSGEIGQRVDGAAQRIEAAVGQLDVNRYDAASQRVESAAALMETSVQEALQALKSASSAMATPSASDMFEEEDRDSV